MSPARGDDSHDQRYTHPLNRSDVPAVEDTRRVVYGRPYVKNGEVVQDHKVCANDAEAAEAVKAGGWFLHPDDHDSAKRKKREAEEARVSKEAEKGPDGGFARVKLLVLTALLAIVALAGPALFAQTTTLTATTLSSALGLPPQGVTSQQTVNLTSATGIAVGQRIYVDRELMTVQSLNANLSTQVFVARGQDGTTAAAHASSAIAYYGGPQAFFKTDVAGTCTSTNETYLPHINTATGNMFNCVATSTLATSPNTNWSQWYAGGLPAFRLGAPLTGWTYATLGAITVQPGVQYIGSGGALAMTLVNPTTAQNGMIMTLFASTAQAHTITYTAGFNGGTTARDVATFGGAIGDQMTIIADGGIWYVLNTRNVTLA